MLSAKQRLITFVQPYLAIAQAILLSSHISFTSPDGTPVRFALCMSTTFWIESRLDVLIFLDSIGSGSRSAVASALRLFFCTCWLGSGSKHSEIEEDEAQDVVDDVLPPRLAGEYHERC